MENLLEIARECDGAVFVLAPDDMIKNETDHNGGIEFTARDNVLAEAGLFYGNLGTKNVVLYKLDGVKMPTDWNGITTIETTEDKGSLNKKLGSWLDNVQRKHCTKSHNVHIQSRKEINELYPINGRLGLTDNKEYKHIIRVRILNLASNILIKPTNAETEHKQQDVNISGIIGRLLKKPKVNIRLIHTKPTDDTLNDAKSKITNISCISTDEIMYSAQNTIYEMLTTDKVYQNAYEKNRFNYFVTTINMPYAIFNVEFKKEYAHLNHVRIDLYSALLNNENLRRSMIIWETTDKENYKFFVDNFDDIICNETLCKKPEMDELKIWSEKWAELKNKRERNI